MTGKIDTKWVSNRYNGEEERRDDCRISWTITPRKKLIVLDVNGLLVHKIFRSHNASIPISCCPDMIIRNHLVFKRPFCDEFLKFCFERFEVGIWSSAKEIWCGPSLHVGGHIMQEDTSHREVIYIPSKVKNVEGVLDYVIGTLRRRLLFTWDQDKCTNSGFMTLENKHKPIFLKELKKLWDNENFIIPWSKGQYTSSNTLLIDDTPYKFLLNPPNTAISPYPYNVENYNDTTLGPKGELRLYLEGLADADADDVPSYVKENPFGQPAITSKHPDWNYYSKIICTLTNRSSAGEKIREYTYEV